MAEMIMLPVGDLWQHPDNPRKNLGDLQELANSIRENGIYQNLTVIPGHEMDDDEWQKIWQQYKNNPSEELRTKMNRRWEESGYTVIIGHRRLAAAKIAGLTEVPCVITSMTEKEQLSTMLLENMQRSDLTPYEEAHGFQMMLDLGETVETIAKESGFSQTTVRRRVKMMELDQDILKQVSSERQLSLSDFDRLAKIDDLTQRNEVLKVIGTDNFNLEVSQKIRHQEIKKGLAALPQETRRLKARKLDRGQTWGCDYQEIKRYKLSEWDRETPLEPDSQGKKLYYYADEYNGDVRFYIEKEKQRAAPVRRSPEEIEREHKLEAAWTRADELREVTRKLRHDFVRGLAVTKANRDAMLTGAIRACLLRTFSYTSTSSGVLYETIGKDPTTYHSQAFQLFSDQLKENPDKLVPASIYAAFGDTDYSANYIEGFKKEWPRHKDSEALNAIYDWLLSVGYVMSDDEKKLRDGSHEILHLGDGQEAKGHD